MAINTSPIPVGARRIEFVANIAGASTALTSARVSAAIRRWQTGTQNILAGAVTFSGESGNPAITVASQSGRRVVRGAIHLTINTAMSTSVLASLLAEALIAAGAIGDETDFAQAFYTSRNVRGATAGSPPISVATMSLGNTSTVRSAAPVNPPRPTATTPASPPPPLPPPTPTPGLSTVPPVALSLADRVATDMVVDATDPAAVGRAPVLSPAVVQDMVSAGDTSGVILLVSGALLAIVLVGAAVWWALDE